jgi:hypothetical protein
VSTYILGIKKTIDAEDHNEQEEKSMSEQEAKQRSRKRTPNNRTTTGFCISALVVGVLQPRLSVHVNTHRGWREDAHG